MKNQLFESYMKRASMFITEDEDMEEEDIDLEGGEDLEGEEDLEGDEELEGEEGEDEEEALELDLSDPVCPECGAKLIPVGGVDASDIDEDEAEDGEADAIELLQGLGYVVYKPTEDELEDEDLGDDEDMESEDDLEEMDFEDEDEEDFEDEEY